MPHAAQNYAHTLGNHAAQGLASGISRTLASIRNLLANFKYSKNWPYRVASHLSSGAFGDAYLVQNDNGEKVVIKRLRGAMSLAEAERSSEIATMGVLNHPNIIKFIDALQEDGYLNIVTEFATGNPANFETVMAQRKLSEAEVLPILKQVASAIVYC
jgi:serine/threonine protein kinase